MESPPWTCPIWKYLIYRRSCWGISTSSGSVRGVWLTGWRRAEASSHDRLLLHLLLRVFVCRLLAGHGKPLSSEADRADRRGAKPRRRHEILSAFVRLHSVSLLSLALSMSLEHAPWSVREWIEEDRRERRHRLMPTQPFFLSQSTRLARTLSRSFVPLISHTWQTMQQ